LWFFLVCNALAAFAMMVVSIMLITSSGPDIAYDWINVWSDNFKTHVQTSDNCCGLYTLNDSYSVGTCPATATQPCMTAMSSNIKHANGVAGAVGVSLSVTMLCTLFGTGVLAVAVKRKKVYYFPPDDPAPTPPNSIAGSDSQNHSGGSSMYGMEISMDDRYNQDEEQYHSTVDSHKTVPV